MRRLVSCGHSKTISNPQNSHLPHQTANSIILPQCGRIIASVGVAKVRGCWGFWLVGQGVATVSWQLVVTERLMSWYVLFSGPVQLVQLDQLVVR